MDQDQDVINVDFQQRRRLTPDEVVKLCVGAAAMCSRPLVKMLPGIEAGTYVSPGLSYQDAVRFAAVLS